MIPKEVCHYTKASTILKILGTKKLRINQLKFTNDPRESKERNAAIVWVAYQSSSSDRDQNAGEIKKGHSSLSFNPTQDVLINSIRREANEIALEEWKVLCVTLHHPQKRVRDIQDEVYNHSIRHGYSRPRMWAQYAENHKGVCIIFDAIRLNAIIHKTHKSQCRIFQGPVSYNYKSLVFNTIPIKDLHVNIKKENLIEALRSHYISNYEETFLIKHPDWRDETEYRWVLHSPKKSGLYVPIENAIKAILIGVDFPKTYEPRLIKFCEELEVSIGRMEWDDGIALARFGSIYQP
jgi:hypothetical protein